MKAPEPAPQNSPLPPVDPGATVAKDSGQKYSSASPDSLRRKTRSIPPRIPDYELIRRIGGGAYGEVWMARSTTGALRAVKIVWRHTFQDERPFQREFEGIQRFERVSREHPGQLALFHVGRNEVEGCFYYVMELADDSNAKHGDSNAEFKNDPEPVSLVRQDGEEGSKRSPLKTETCNFETYSPRTLRHDLQAQGRLPATRVLELGLALTEALAHLHQCGLVHRDVKPSNIIFVNGRPKLADIGLVTDVDTTLSYVGTDGYIPPEGPGAVQADIFSLGKVLYEISTGKDRRDFPDLPADLKNWPDQAGVLELNEVLVKACTREVQSRYQTCQEMHDDLALLERGQSIKRQRLWGRRWRAVSKVAAGVVALALLGAGLKFLKVSRREHATDPEVLKLYEDGRWHYSMLTEDHHARAFTNLSLATARDPRFIPAYGELTALYVWNIFSDLTNEERRRRTQEIADQVLAIDSDAAEGHTALSWCHFLDRDWAGAEEEIKRAIKLGPNLPFPHVVYCFYLSVQGRTQEAQRVGQRAQELEPSQSRRVTAIVASWPFIAARRFDLAIQQLQRCMELDANFPIGHHYLGKCYEAQSNYVAAIEEFERFELSAGKNRDRVITQFAALRKAYEDRGPQGYFRQWIEKIRADEADDLSSYGEVAAEYYAMLGDKEKAIKEIEDNFDTFGVWQVLKFEPHYDSLRNEPRFKALVKRAGLDQ